MKIKKFAFIFFIFCLMVTISGVSAADDLNVTETQNNNENINKNMVNDVNQEKI